MSHAHNRSESESSAGRVGAKRRIETKRACMWPRSLDFDTLRYSIGARSDPCCHALTGADERFRAAISRVRQFLAAVRARVSDDEIAVLEQYLEPSQRDLFGAISPIDQRHCLDVFKALLRQGHSNPDLLRAALLHDVGKRRIRLWHRVAGVLLEAFWPTLLEKLAVNRPQSWLYGFYIYRYHANLSAELAERSGCSPSVVELIRGHHTPSENEVAKALWEADRLS
jgi:hypothetical protein